MNDPLSLEAFRDFCASKPADEGYRYLDTFGCAFAQYLESIGYEMPNVGASDFTYGPISSRSTKLMPRGVDASVSAMGNTFGALTARLNALIAEQSP